MKKLCLLLTFSFLALFATTSAQNNNERVRMEKDIQLLKEKHLPQQRKFPMKQLKNSKELLKSSESHKHQLDSIIDQDDYGIYKIIFTYEENGNRISVFYDWDSEISAWIKPLKLEDTFDENGNMTSETKYNWNSESNGWVEAYKRTYTYDENGNVTSSNSYNWNSGISAWDLYYKSEYTHHTNGKETLVIEYTWNSSKNVWVENAKYELTYDSYGNLISESTYVWDSGTTTSWKEEVKYEYAYDAYGNEILYAYYYWKSGINDWVGFYKSESTYDYTISASEIRLPYGNFTHKIVDKVSYEFRDGNWVHDFTTEFFYSEIASSYLKELDVHAVRLFPNPATDFISIQGIEGENYQFKLLNLQGSTLLSKENNGNEQISVQNIESGVYIYQIIDSNGNHKTGRIVIK